MNKLLRKVMVFALAGTMAVGMSTAVFAETSNLNDSSANIADTQTINLLKDYVNGSDEQTYTKSPEETLKFTIERYGLWNVGEDGIGNAKYDINNMPTFEKSAQDSKNTFTIHVEAGMAGNIAQNKQFALLTVPTYEAVGDYWYKVTETDNNVAGVLYGTNDGNSENIEVNNGNHNAVYYIHVQVTNASVKNQYIRTVTLHKEAPDVDKVNTNVAYENWYKDNNGNAEDQTNKKVNDIQNKYYAGSLNIKKVVDGNAGDKNELFKIAVVFKNESGASMNSTITYKNFYNDKGNKTTDSTEISWKDEVNINESNDPTHTKQISDSVEFWLKDGDTVTFDNIPYGVSYTITETQPSDDKYTHKFEFADNSADNAGLFNGVETKADTVCEEDNTKTDVKEKWNGAYATGSITDVSDTVTITNTKESTIDIGVITSNAPYVAMLLLVAAAAFVFVHRRNNMIEE